MQRGIQDSSALEEQGGLDNEARDDVRIEVGGRAAVLIVAALLHGDHAADADGAAAVGDAPAEIVHAAGLVLSSQAALVAFAVGGNVDSVALPELLALGLDGVPAGAFGAGEGVGVVGVPSGTVPVAGDGLGVKGDRHVVHLRNAVQDVAADPEIVSHLGPDAGPHLMTMTTTKNQKLDLTLWVAMVNRGNRRRTTKGRT